MGPLRYLVFVAVGLVVATTAVSCAQLRRQRQLGARRRLRRAVDRARHVQSVRAHGHGARQRKASPSPMPSSRPPIYDERLTTRSNHDGTFVLAAAEAVCDRRPPRTVQLLVMADDFRPKRHSVPFETASLDIMLDARDFRP